MGWSDDLSQIYAVYAAQSGETSIVWPGQRQDPQGQAYSSLSHDPISRDFMGVSRGQQLYRGLVTVQVFEPNHGAESAGLCRDRAQAIQDVFLGKSWGGIEIWQVDMQEVGIATAAAADGRTALSATAVPYYQINVSIEYSSQRAPDSREHEMEGLIEIEAPGHSLSPYDLVYFSSGVPAAAIASSDTTRAAGVVVAISGDTVQVRTSGILMAYQPYGAATGSRWLSQSAAGAAVSTIPATGWAQEVLEVVDDWRTIVRPGAAVYQWGAA